MTKEEDALSLALQVKSDIFRDLLSCSTILRKAYTVCTLLNLEKEEKWLRNELQGYQGTYGELEKTMPKYRKVKLHFRDSYGRPIIFRENTRIYHDHVVAQSIAEIENSADTGFTILGGPLIDHLRESGFDVYTAKVEEFRLKNILEQVKNLVLDFVNKVIMNYGSSYEPANQDTSKKQSITFIDEQTETARKLLYELENQLRMFINSKVKNDRKRIKASFLRSWKSLKKKEHMPPRRPVECDLINYSTFDEIRLIITQNENWSQIFQKYFGRPEGIISRLREFDSIRDTIAHNRMISDFDFNSFKTMYNEIMRCMEE